MLCSSGNQITFIHTCVNNFCIVSYCSDFLSQLCFFKMLKFWSLWKKDHWIRVLSLKAWGYKSDFPVFSFRSQLVCVLVISVLWSGDRWIPVYSIACLIYNEIVWFSERQYLKKIKRRLREEVIYSTSYSNSGKHRCAF